MARINIDDDLFKMKGFEKLMLKLGSKRAALGALVEAYMLAQKFYKSVENDRLIPFIEWEQEEIANEIMDAGLASRREKGIYVHGSEKQFSWLLQRQEAGSKPKGKRKKTLVDRPITDDQREQAESNGVKPPTPSHTLPLSPTHTNSLSSDSNSNLLSKLDLRNAVEMDGEEIKRLLISMGITLTPDEVIDLYNCELAGVGKLRRCHGLGTPQIKDMLITFTQFPTIESWQKLFKEARKAKKITGEEPGGYFLATLKWLSVRANALKVMNGDYELLNSEESNVLGIDLTNEEVEELRAAGELP